ncbi:hypothetical protein F751_6874 [Auxenochlorella protothecoides]|uniref:Uncharacterized protein n=1 Tax=Auxenochlorella protothecoides TaxID=3075 RepID=A0A087SDV2_AUXPR|nr:hypothetical protein F751_6874 [Auxenochlorella protothecoides]KFM23906.1 hypothetical protein F751_6874 [Auxenochlorella protothecoides]
MVGMSRRPPYLPQACTRFPGNAAAASGRRIHREVGRHVGHIQPAARDMQVVELAAMADHVWDGGVHQQAAVVPA